MVGEQLFPSEGLDDPEYLPSGRLRLNYIQWADSVDCITDTTPAYGFEMLDRPEDRNCPEFLLKEIQEFLNNRYFEIEEEE